MKPRWAATATFLVGLALGPPVIAIFDAFNGSLHEQNRSSGQRLIRNYDDAGPRQPLVLRGYPDWLNERPKECSAGDTHDARIVLQDDDLDQLLILDNAWTDIYDRELSRARTVALEKMINPFWRTVLADCLSFAPYSGACRPIARELIARADAQSRAQRKIIAGQLLAHLGPLRCTIWRQAVARKRDQQSVR